MNEQQVTKFVSYTSILSTLEREGLSNSKLKSLHTKIRNQEQKGDAIDKYTLDEVHGLLASLFVEPKYTYVVSRHCKPILPLLVSQLIDQCLSNADQELHDRVTSAISKVLPIYPQFLRFLYIHLQDRPSLLDRALSKQMTKLSTKERASFIELIKTAFRLLHYAPEDFSKMWNWSPFFALLEVNDEELKWYASRCVSVLLQYELIERNVASNLKKISEHDQFVIESNEEEEVYLNQVLSMHTDSTYINKNNGDQMSDDDEFTSSNQLSDNIMINVCGVWIPKKKNATNDNSLKSKLVFTETTTENMRALALAVSQGAPVLLEGITGSGKTALVEELALLTGNTDLIKVNLDESFDSKDLLGTYVCTDIPGEFRWQAGALTKAVTEGRWILIEDLDLAPFDIVSAIIPLIESNTLFIPSRDEVIPAHNGFHIFATQSMVETFSGAASRQRVLTMANLWTQVLVEKLPSLEIEQVLKVKSPAIAHLIPKFIDTYETLRGTKSTLSVEDVTDTELLDEEDKNRNRDFAQLKNFGRLFSFRDLLKWISRIDRFYAHKINKDYLLSQIKKDIFHEAVDVFCGMIVKKNVYKAVVHTIASVWGITDYQHYLDLYKPQVTEGLGSVTIGRIVISREQKNLAESLVDVRKFAHTKQSLRLMERAAACVQMKEPILLTGETGTGKTSIIQHLATLLGKKLIVHNLNQQTDSADFIGGFKPVDLRILALSLKNNFEKLFSVTFSLKQNAGLLEKVRDQFEKRNWASLVILFQRVIERAYAKLEEGEDSDEEPEEAQTSKKSKKRKSKSDSSSRKQQKVDRQTTLRQYWQKFSTSVEKFNIQQNLVQNSFAFSFIEGTLVKALKEGHWILLDEINLASTETLERLSSLLDGEEGTLFITEKGDTEPVKRHPDFRLFACMNPPTDIGKKNLPPALRNRFTEFYVQENLDPEDLKVVVSKYLEKHQIANPPTDAIVKFYLEAKSLSEVNLSDGAGQKPHYSLRTLARSLEYASIVLPTYGLQRALYEGFCMGFLTLLSRTSFDVMEELVRKHLCNKNKDALTAVPKRPGDGYVQFEHFWLRTGDHPVHEDPNFIITKSVQEHLKNLARAIKTGKYPILLQGPTSAGKTSMVSYLAKRTGHRFVRINNHESTDLQEYFGTYITNSEGKLVFQEGILVEAVRNGYWIVLDELNLAPSDILEALNRLLDDNRELFIPETQEIIKPHPHFTLFATQNPPGLYGGRKVLSRAFRNRFLEFHVDDIPGEELKTILQRRCGISNNLADRMVSVMKQLQIHRQSSKIFAGKQGFITPRDLFRWAERVTTWKNDFKDKQQIAEEGYMLLAERLRRDDEKELVRTTVEKCLKVSIDVDKMYDCEASEEFKQIQQDSPTKIVWTKTMKRLFTLVGKCLSYKEPVLLVGETGCGKTTICQIYSEILKNRLHILNCHQHTETSDFLGSLRPVRGRDALFSKLKKLIAEFAAEYKNIFKADIALTNIDENTADVIKSLEKVCGKIVKKRKDESSAEKDFPGKSLLQLQLRIREVYHEWKSLFIWYDGPIVEAMKNGDLFLIDEISLAEDAVLERLNSVLEPDRTLVLPEKGSETIEELVAQEGFRVMATMNPGGDFGKKELSPALRNRFTEIYVPTLSVKEDLALIIANRLSSKLQQFSLKMVDFVNFFRSKKSKRILSIRDVISWIDFLNLAVDKLSMNAYESYIHGAEVVILEGVGIGTDILEKTRQTLRRESVEFLLSQIAEHLSKEEFQTVEEQFTNENIRFQLSNVSGDANQFGFYPFFIDHGPNTIPKSLHYSLNAPTTSKNVMKVLRAMQLRKPLLLEGSPGVGKTSLIQAIAKASGHNIVRINLSEQTDMMDLLGSDLPIEGSSGGQFRWSDGIFLRALKEGDWVLLDELNLASQSVLEGLNSVLDHRAEIYIPELNRTFSCPKSFRIFACQNPLQQGGGRKGLPKSFLNRFTQVYIDQMQSDDLLFIAKTMHGDIGEDNLRNMIKFNELMYEESMVQFKFARKGSPWEFNLRDVFRWCELLLSEEVKSGSYDPSRFVDCVYRQRMRTEEDRQYVSQLYARVFGTPYSCSNYPTYTVTNSSIQIGQTELATNQLANENDSNHHASVAKNDYVFLQSFLNPLENILKCIQLNYMCIVTGSSGTGKTSLVRLAAQITGNILNEFSMSSSTDTVELLGTFEQVDPSQKQRQIASGIKRMIDDIARRICGEAQTSQFEKIISLYNDWTTLQSTSQRVEKTKDDKLQRLSLLKALVETVHSFAITLSLSSEQEYQDVLTEIDNIQKLIEDGVKGRFGWNDGALIRSMEAGHWLLIDNVNFCNPTVLDRLNGLLEPNGVLVVNERGIVDGDIKVVKPHHNFRIFMVMDPKYGEISRAMRNRGVEIFLMPLPIPSQDAFTLLSAAGVQSAAVIQKLLQFHNEYIAKIRTTEDERPTIRDLLRCAEIFLAECSQGLSVFPALKTAIRSVYIRNKCIQQAHKIEAASLLSTIIDEQAVSNELAVIPSPYLSKYSFALTNPRYRSTLRQGAFLYFTAQRVMALKLENQINEKDLSVTAVLNNLKWPTLISELSPAMIQRLLGAKINAKALDKDTLRDVVSKLLREFNFASEYFITRTPLEDTNYRIMWLDRLKVLCQGEPDLCATLDKTKHLLLQRASSDLAKDITTKVKKTVIPKIDEQALRDVIPHQPLDLRLNSALFKKLKYLGTVQQVSENSFDKISLLSLIMSNKYEEERGLGTNSNSVIQQSMKHQKSKKSSKLSDTDVLQFLHPLLQAVDQLLDAVIRSSNESISLVAVHALLIQRIRLWQYLAKITSMSEEFLIYWNWFCKSFNACNFNSINDKGITKLAHHITNIMSEIENRCNKLFDSISRKNLLWKEGKHPRVVASGELKDLKQQIDNFVATHNLVGKSDLNAMIMKAMSTINYMNESRNTTGLETLSTLSTRLEDAYKTKSSTDLSTKEAKEQELENMFQTVHNWATEDLPEEIIRESTMNRHSQSELLPLFDYNSMAKETALIASIAQFNLALRQKALFNDVLAFNNSLQELRSKLHQLIQYVLIKTSRSPLDMVGYQTLLWTIDAIQTQSAYSTSNQEQIYEKLSIVPVLVQEIWMTWSTRLWDNSYNKVEQMQRTNEELSPNMLEGPNRLFQDINSVRILSILRDWKSVPIRARFTKIDQLKKVVEFMCSSQDTEDTTKFDWHHALQTFCDTLVCFDKSFELNDRVEFTEIIKQILEQQPDSNHADKLLNIVQKTSDLRLKSMQDTILHIAKAIDEKCSSGYDGNGAVLRARLWVLIGVLRLKLIIPAQSLDPALKYAVTVQHIKPAITENSEKVDVFARIERFITGASSNLEIDNLQSDLQVLQASLLKFEGQVVNRAESQSFKMLYKDLKDFVESLVPGKLESIMKPIFNLSEDAENIEEIQSEILVKEDMIQANMSMVARNLMNNYDSYRDILIPFTTSVYQIKYGLRLLSFHALAPINEKDNNQINTITRDIVSFPSTNDIYTIANDAELLYASLVVASKQKKNHKKKYDRYQTLIELVRVLLSKLHLYLLTNYSTSNSEDTLSVVEMVMTVYSLLFKTIEDETKQYEKEQEDIYKYKEQTTIIDTDEDLLAREIDRMFPTFMEHYEQFMKREDDGPEAATQSGVLENKELKQLSQSLFNPVELSKLVDIHREIYLLVNKAIVPSQSEVENTRNEMFERSMQVAGRLITNINASQNMNDAGLLPFILYGSQAISDMTEKLNIQAKPDASVFDVYSDSNIPEVSLAFNTLFPMVARFHELLKKYEKHPILVQMTRICEKILDLPVSSPLIKILTGLEVLLSKAAEWQEYLTSPAGSLKEQILKLTVLIIRWRKMELENWRSIFGTKRKEFKSRAVKWWFRFYRLISTSYFKDEEDNQDAEKVQKACQEFLAICDDYMRTAPVGEFSDRLELLPNFFAQLQVELDCNLTRKSLPDELKQKFKNILFNVYKFYQQFQQPISTKIENEVKPIEEKLKNFVKLMKWEDVNVDSLKQSTNKSRRQLGKFSKSYNEILVKPARDIWDHYNPEEVQNQAAKDVPKPKNRKERKLAKKKRREERRNKKSQQEESVAPTLTEELNKLAQTFAVSKPSVDSVPLADFMKEYVSILQPSEDDVFSSDKLGSIDSKIERNLNKFVLQNSKVIGECDMTVDYLEDLSTSVITRMKELQSSDAPKMLKKRALGDLLKELKSIGISSLLAKIRQQLSSQLMFEQPETHLVQGINCQDNADLWSKSDDYYYKNIFGLQKIRFAFDNETSTDLNDKEKKQMMGFSENLFWHLLSQRASLNRLQTEQKKFGSFMQTIKNVRTAVNQTNLRKSTVIPSQKYVSKWIGDLQEYYSKFAELAEELYILFDSLKAVSVNRQASMKKVDSLRSLVVSRKKELDSIATNDATTLFTSSHLTIIDKSFAQMKEIEVLVGEIEIESAQVVPRCKELSNLIEEGKELAEEHQTEKSELSKPDPAATTKFKQLFSDCVKGIQLSVQRLVKQFQEEEERVNKILEERAIEQAEEKKSEEEQTEEDSMFHNEYKEDSVSRLTNLFESAFNTLALSLGEVNKKMTQLKQLLAEASESEVDQKDLINICSVFMSKLLPLMERLVLKVDLIKYPFLSLHKAMNKLEYILLCVFATLFKDGFCGSDEGEGEGDAQESGQTNFSAGTGMDDGEGINDVTDKLENEDQIMNAKDQEINDDKKKDDKTEAAEVETDFAGELEDVDKQEKDEDDSEEEEEDDEDMDKDMGEIDDDDPNKETLDKKMWDEDNEDDKDDREDENNDGENGNEQQVTELQAKEDEQDEPQSKKPQKKEMPKPGTEENPQEEIEQEEFKDVVNEEQMQDENENQDPEQPDFHLPEEMDLQDDGDDENEGDEENPEEQSDEEGDEQDDGSLAQPPMPEREEDIEEIQQEDAVTEDQMQQDIDENEDQKEQGVDPATNEAETPDPSNEDEKMGEKDESEEKEDEEEDDKEKEKVQTEEEEAFQEDLKETPFGVQQTAGKASEIKNKEDEEQREEKKKNQAEEESGKDTNKSQQGESMDKGNDKKEENKEQSDAAQFDPNPMRSLGDALKEWKQKLKMVEQLKDDKEEEKDQKQDQADSDDEFEFSKKDQEDKDNDMQVLAPATEEQAEQFPELENKPDEEEDGEDEEVDKQKNKNDNDMSDNEDEEGADDNRKNNGRVALRFDQKKDDDEEMDIDEEDMVDDVDEAIKKEPNTSNADEKLTSTIHTKVEITGSGEAMEEEPQEDAKQLTMEDIAKMREELDVMLSEWRNDQDKVDRSKDAWKRFDMLTSHLSQELCEQLRLILEPTLATKLKGDYKTGKRINMKKVIPYIASQFRKDKIWLRRTKPNKRQYQVLLAIDDSKSMADNNAGQMACEALTLISKAMAQLEVGQLSVVSFGEQTRLLHPFERPFTDETGSEMLAQFTFDQTQTQIFQFMQEAVQMLDSYKSLELVNNSEQVQLAFIISDGRMLDRESIVKMIRQAQEKRQLFVFILIDNPNPKDSILELKSVTYPNGKLTVTPYIDQFPFPYYIILRDIQALPEILADALRQFFEVVNQQGGTDE